MTTPPGEALREAAEAVVESALTYSSEDMFGVYPVGLFGHIGKLQEALATPVAGGLDGLTLVLPADFTAGEVKQVIDHIRSKRAASQPVAEEDFEADIQQAATGGPDFTVASWPESAPVAGGGLRVRNAARNVASEDASGGYREIAGCKCEHCVALVASQPVAEEGETETAGGGLGNTSTGRSVGRDGSDDPALHQSVRSIGERTPRTITQPTTAELERLRRYDDLPDKAVRFRDRGILNADQFAAVMGVLFVSDEPISDEDKESMRERVATLIAEGKLPALPDDILPAPGLPHSIEERIADDNGDELERGEPDYAGQ